MPAEPSSALLSKMLKRPIKSNGPTQKPRPLDPSWLRSGFEGAVDTLLGALGIGPDTTMNRAGALISAAIPMMGAKRLKGLGRYPEFDLANSPSEVFPVQNRLAMGMNPSEGIYDEAGRYLAPKPKIDPAYEAHVASSRNKFPIERKGIEPSEDLMNRMMEKRKLKPLKIQSMEEAFVSKGER
jgi:hypothetical protein